MDPTNFVNASWSINWLKVYRRQNVVGVVNAGTHSPIMQWSLPMLLGITTAAAFSLVVL
jgi:hypothetical protein